MTYETDQICKRCFIVMATNGVKVMQCAGCGNKVLPHQRWEDCFRSRNTRVEQ